MNVVAGQNHSGETPTESISVYPNPANTSVSVKIDLLKNSLISITLYDISGKQISLTKNQSMNAGSNTIEIDTQFLEPGYYLLTINTDTSAQTIPLIKQ
jgi:hypothetical protein